jgi:branched-chain amino acid transport system permease protein
VLRCRAAGARLAAAVAAAAAALVAPATLNLDALTFLTSSLILAIFAMSLDLVWGYAGVFLLGHAAFFGLGAYAAALLATKAGLTELLVVVPIGVIVGGLAAGLLAVFLFAGRRATTMLYVALATLAVSYILERLAGAWDFVGASNGIPALPVPTLAGAALPTGWPFYTVVVVILAAFYAVARWVLSTRFGLVLAAIRQDPERAASFGFRVAGVQAALLAAAGGAAAGAGVLFAFHEGSVSPSQLGVVLSTQVVLWVILGGQRTLVGPVAGALLYAYAARNLSERFATQWPVVLGALLLACVLWLPGGLATLPQRVLAARRRRRSAPVATAPMRELA